MVEAASRRASMLRVLLALVVAAAAVGVPAALFIIRLQADDRPSYYEAAEEFVRYVALANAPVPGAPEGDSRTGFQRAYELLSSDYKRQLPFDVFHEDWSRLFDERGYIVDRQRPGRGTRPHAALTKRRGYPVSFLLLLGDDTRRHSELDAIILEIVLGPEDGRTVVLAFGWGDVPNPEAR